MPDRIKEQVKKKEKYLNLFEELDRTGKLRKASYKEKVTFTIDEELMIGFRQHCEQNDIKMSSKVERLIRDYLDGG